MFTLKGCEEVANALAPKIVKGAFGTSNVEHNYTDTALFNKVFEKDVDDITILNNGELNVKVTINFDEMNGINIQENAILSNSKTLTVDTQFPLEKNNSEQYNYFFGIYIVPEESLFE